MTTENNNNLSDEIVIVGSSYGNLLDILKPIFEKGGPISVTDIAKAIGSNEVYLSPESNVFDHFSVGVYTISQQLLGHVWMYQSYYIFQWLRKNNCRYIKARITEVKSKTGLMIATAEQEICYDESCRSESIIENSWADNLPETMTNITEEGLSLGLALLRDNLMTCTEWNDVLKMRIDSMLNAMPYDLSDHNSKECFEAYRLMKDSPIAEVRALSEDVLYAFVHRGSNTNIKWWENQYLPDFFKSATDSDVLGMFEADNFTLEDVEALLRTAPAHLFQFYVVNRYRFVKQLYYTALPRIIYYRLLTLLAVREAMLEKRGEQKEDVYSENEELLWKAEVTNSPEFSWATAEPHEVALPTQIQSAQPLSEQPKKSEEELNYFAPTMALKKMLTGEWFDEYHTGKYDKVWIERFVDDLMASECKEEIARTWKQSSKRTTLKGNILGALKYAGVIAGSDLCIAAAVSVGSKDRSIKTFACYIGKGKKSKFRDWICSYINK